jgi:antitoxin (DNA-binding transcriptional repressor) of toxin-antitoxin stability system
MEIQLQQFQTQSLQLIEQLKQTGEEITLTENGKAIAKVVPILSPKTSSFIGYMQGSIVVHGDIIEPVGDRWEVSES